MNMSKEQAKQVEDALVAFVIRVSGDKYANPAESAALPEIARILFGD